VRKTVCKGFESHSPKDNGVKADNRELITLLGKWLSENERVDYFSSSLIGLVGSNPTYSSKVVVGLLWGLISPLIVSPPLKIWC